MATPTSTAISERLQRDAVQVLECTIHEELTLDEWRRLRPRTPRGRPRRPTSRTPRTARHLTLVPDAPRVFADALPPLAA